MPRCHNKPMILTTPAPSYAWPGGYPLYYLADDGGCICPDCVNANRESIDVAYRDDDPQWNVVAYDVHWEGAPLQCDNCNASIESAYGDDGEGD